MQCDVRVVRNLGIYLDSDLIIIIIRQLIRRRNMSIKSLQGRMMRTHVAKTVSSCFAVLRQLRSIRRSVSDPVLQSLVVALLCHRCSRNCIGCECPSVSPSGWQFLLTDVSTTWRRVTSPPSSTRRATLVYARRRRPCSMFLASNT